MLELFEYEFMQRAFLGGLFIALSCALLGVFLVLRRLSMLGDGLAHASFAGVAIGLLLNTFPILTALIFSAASALGIQKLVEKTKVYGESAIAVVLSFSVALAVVLIGLSKNLNTNIFSYLFGSLLTLSWFDVYVSLGVLLVVLSFLYFSYRKLFYLSFNEDVAKVRGISVGFVNGLFTILVAVVIVFAIRAVGILLVSSLLVLPALIGLKLGSTLKKSLIYSSLSAVLGIVLGVFLSYVFNLPTGGVIVLVLVFLFLLSLLIKKLKR